VAVKVEFLDIETENIETTVWNLAGFTVGFETRWQRVGQFLDDL